MDPLTLSQDSSALAHPPPPAPLPETLGLPPPPKVSSVQQYNNSNNYSNRLTVPSACVACRSKHLKCDGLNPCTRCSANSVECLYVRSRRGFKGPRRNGKPPSLQGNNNNTATTAISCPLVRPGQPASLSSGIPSPPDHSLQVLPHVISNSLFPNGHELVTLDSAQSRLQSAPLDIRERCIEAFFYHFHASHPFVLPQPHLLKLLKEKPMDHLDAAIRYIGSFYVAQASTEALGMEVERSIYRMDSPRDGFMVQSMLLLAIGLDSYTYQDKALEILIAAQDLAMELGMHKRDFALMNGNELEVLEESWRRTWWELFVVDGIIATVHQKSSFRLNQIATDVQLPCEEKEYASGHIPPSRTLADFDDDSFSGEDFCFSSFAYRIAAIRNTGMVLQLGQIMFADDPSIDRVDAHLVNWKLHLPDSKKTFISSDRQLDEMLFQAHMITEATTIVLHRDHSQLDSSAAQNITSCAPHRQITPGQQYNVHAAKIIQSAQNISKLITLPTPLTKHTVFFTCVVTLASIVHLSCWSVLMPPIHDADLKQQLRLNIGALKGLCQIWPTAGKAFGQVKGVAQEMFAAKKAAAAGFWANFTEEEIMRNMIDDESIMEEFSEGPYALKA